MRRNFSDQNPTIFSTKVPRESRRWPIRFSAQKGFFFRFLLPRGVARGKPILNSDSNKVCMSWSLSLGQVFFCFGWRCCLCGLLPFIFAKEATLEFPIVPSSHQLCEACVQYLQRSDTWQLRQRLVFWNMQWRQGSLNGTHLKGNQTSSKCCPCNFSGIFFSGKKFLREVWGWSFVSYLAVSKNRGKTPKMDGLFHGKPYEQMDDLGG